jgi:hypothetical protein
MGYYMVKLKYSALYTDNLGCEQAIVYFYKGGFQLKVRGCIFKNDSLNFDFYAVNYNKSKLLFYLKDNGLIEYAIDIKIPLTVYYNNKECIEEFLLRIERCGNYYNNSLSLYLKDISYTVEGYDLHELISNMNKELPKEYHIKHSFLCLVETDYFDNIKENKFCTLKDFEAEFKTEATKDYYYNLFNSANQKKFDKIEKIAITYIYDKCYSS